MSHKAFFFFFFFFYSLATTVKNIDYSVTLKGCAKEHHFTGLLETTARWSERLEARPTAPDRIRTKPSSSRTLGSDQAGSYLKYYVRPIDLSTRHGLPLYQLSSDSGRARHPTGRVVIVIGGVKLDTSWPLVPNGQLTAMAGHKWFCDRTMT